LIVFAYVTPLSRAIYIWSRLQGSREDASIALLVPSGNPFIGTQRSESLLELVARGEIFAFGIDTFVKVDVVLPAVGEEEVRGQ